MIFSEELYEQISKITGVDYEGWLNKDREEYFVTEKNIEGMIEDLIAEVEHWKEQYEDLKQDVQENYKLKEIDPYDYYGVSREDFIDRDF